MSQLAHFYLGEMEHRVSDQVFDFESIATMPAGIPVGFVFLVLPVVSQCSNSRSLFPSYIRSLLGSLG